jgi:hypothetical protein
MVWKILNQLVKGSVDGQWSSLFEGNYLKMKHAGFSHTKWSLARGKRTPAADHAIGLADFQTTNPGPVPGLRAEA